ncbi:DNRLRE domain-containing protein [Oryzobacter sp. R7]|uniref:CBM96 family carbohydrate-binding protein n=1 Tax=Oryzobacter faecalis TaxID=3388656 RepID=UPI00398D31FD
MSSPSRRAGVRATAAALVLGAALVAVQPSAATQSSCTTTTAAGWSATLCLSVAVDASATGPVQISATVDVSPGGPRVAKAEFALRDQYLLTDYEAPYTFVLDTADFVDGAASLRAQAVFRDGSISDPASVDLTFANDVTTPPGPTGSYTPPTSPASTKSDPLVVAAVGDGAGGEQAATDVTDMIAAWQPEMLTYLGDVYDDGTITEFKNWYGDSTSWYGRFKGITAPVVGNHEYNKTATGTFEADGYFRYWNGISPYYSFDAGGWHVVALDSTTQYNQTAPGTPQYEWLVQDLANRANPCTVVLWHHPLNTVGSEGPSQRLSAMWQVLRQNDVTLVLTGHDHQYQHWAPLDGNQQPDPDGVTQMVSGAGGHSSQSITGSDPRVVATAQAYGALRLEVYPERIDYTYRTPDGSTGKVLDSGFVRCAALSPDTGVPTRPTALTATLRTTGMATYSADLAWAAADDDRGVAQYRIRQNGAVLATVPANTLAYTARYLAASSTFAFTVTALDAAGNESPASVPASVTTPAPTPVTEVAPTDADTYTSEQQPTKNYGRATTLRLDADPATSAYLRFPVTGSHPNVTQATLRVWAATKATAGIAVSTVPTTWGELTLTAANAPTAGPVIASSGAVAANTWVDLDVTSAVVGNGTYAFKITTPGTTAASLASREGGAPTTAQLVVSSRPPPDTQPPTVPGNVQAVAASQTRVDLTWTASTDNDAVSYYTVYRDGLAKDTVPATQHAYVDTDVNAGRAYTYAVDAVDPSENHSALSATSSVSPPDETPPELPDPFDVVLTGPTTVSLRWGASTDNVGITGYRLKRDNPTLAQLPASATSFDDDTVKAGRTYTYALSTTDAAGNRSDTVSATITVPQDSGGSPPTTPGNVTATATGEHTVNVEWTASTDDTGLSGYEIFRDGLSAGLAGASATAWNDTNLASATTYTYTVRAIDENANSSPLSSPPAVATTWAPDTTAPSVPGAVQATGASLTSVGVSWSASTDDRGVTGYRVYRDGTAVGGDLPATATSYTDTGLATGSTHTYEVDAVDAAGNRSARSAPPVGARTLVPAPTTQTFVVGADAYVNSASPTSKYGAATTLRLDGDPVVSSYLRFTTSNVQPVVTSAVLRVYANARNTSTVEARTTSSTWDEATISWNTAPAPGAVAGSAGPTAAAGWVDIPVTATVTGNGTWSFVLSQSGVTAVAYQSKEAGTTTAAVLVVTSSY